MTENIASSREEVWSRIISTNPFEAMFAVKQYNGYCTSFVMESKFPMKLRVLGALVLPLA